MSASIAAIVSILAFSPALTSCHSHSSPATAQTPAAPRQAEIYTSISYTDSIRVKMAIDTTLSYIDGFDYDSAVAVDYEGREDNLTDILNNNGAWISTIKQFKKLSPAQVKKVQTIIGSAATYEHPQNAACFVPHLGIAYFKYGEVKAQTAICLSCLGIESTAMLGNFTKYSSINTEAADQLGSICTELGFSFCKENKAAN